MRNNPLSLDLLLKVAGNNPLYLDLVAGNIPFHLDLVLKVVGKNAVLLKVAGYMLFHLGLQKVVNNALQRDLVLKVAGQMASHLDLGKVVGYVAFHLLHSLKLFREPPFLIVKGLYAKHILYLLLDRNLLRNILLYLYYVSHRWVAGIVLDNVP